MAPEHTVLGGATVDEHELTKSAVLARRSLPVRASTVTCKEGTAS